MDLTIDLIKIIGDEFLNDQTKSRLVEYCQDEIIHNLLNLIFGEVLCSVWKTFTEHKDLRIEK